MKIERLLGIKSMLREKSPLIKLKTKKKLVGNFLLFIISVMYLENKKNQ